MDWIVVGKWVIDNKFCRHWKQKKGSNNAEVDMEDEDEQDDDQVGFEMLLERDEGFNTCRVGEWNRNDEEEEEQIFFMGSSLEESFQAARHLLRNPRQIHGGPRRI